MTTEHDDDNDPAPNDAEPPADAPAPEEDAADEDVDDEEEDDVDDEEEDGVDDEEEDDVDDKGEDVIEAAPAVDEAAPPDAPAAAEPVVEAAAADAAAAEAPAAEEAAEEQGPPFVPEEWVYSAIEALVFASNEPLAASRAREVIGSEMETMESMEGKGRPTLGDMKACFRTVLERWSDPTRTVAHGFRIVEVDGGLAFRTVAANARFIKRMQMGKPQKLSRATLETLSVIAYKQPVTKPQIEEVRGVDSSGAVKALLDKKLIRILGKAEEIGRPLLYGTTKTFLELFEMNSLNDLPTLKELHELEHGVDPSTLPAEADDRPAVIMDLFNADQVSAVSAETEAESNEAMEALERALGEAKDVAKRASTLVFGIEGAGDDDAPATNGNGSGGGNNSGGGGDGGGEPG